MHTVSPSDVRVWSIQWQSKLVLVQLSSFLCLVADWQFLLGNVLRNNTHSLSVTKVLGFWMRFSVSMKRNNDRLPQVTFNLDRWAAHWLKEEFIYFGIYSVVLVLKLEQRTWWKKVELNVSLNIEIKQRTYCHNVHIPMHFIDIVRSFSSFVNNSLFSLLYTERQWACV